MYLDANNCKNELRYWPLSQNNMTNNSTPVASTLAPLYEENTRKDLMYFVYNDQPPKIYSGTRNGHSKGVLLFDDKFGVWLLHSVPQFVNGLHSGEYRFPENAWDNGQMFMCVTFATSEVNKIARLLRTEYANVYARQVPQAMKVKYREVALLAEDSFVSARDEKLYDTDLFSEGGVPLRGYAKRTTAREDIYFGVLAEALEGAIAVQSWRNGAGSPLPDQRSSTCAVVNIDGMIMEYEKDKRVNFSATVDHSKWAFAIDKDIFCFASMNRMLSQAERRGGEALCFNNHAVKVLFRRSAVTNERCPVSGGEHATTERTRDDKPASKHKSQKTTRTQDEKHTSKEKKTKTERTQGKISKRGRA